MVGYGWYRLQPGQAPDPAAFDAALGAVIGFIDQATRRYPIDPARLAVVGFSQGGSLAYACGLHHRPRFAAVAALSSWLNPLLLDSAVSLSGLPLLIQHGSRDELVQVERGREAVEQLRATGAQVVYREYDMGHEINAAGVRDLSEFLTDHLQLRRAGR
jgi:phospholipase/carboxylesterase